MEAAIRFTKDQTWHFSPMTQARARITSLKQSHNFGQRFLSLTNNTQIHIRAQCLGYRADVRPSHDNQRSSLTSQTSQAHSPVVILAH